MTNDNTTNDNTTNDITSPTLIHPFVALMRTYCIDYTNSHDQSLYDEFMDPGYVVHSFGRNLPRDTRYAAGVEQIFALAPGLGLVVHEFVLNGDRLAMHFSEHAAVPAAGGLALTCWRGIGLYRWDGTRLLENWVEQDYLALKRQGTRYKVTTQRVVVDSGIFSKKLDQLDLYRVTDFVVDRPFSQRLVGTGNIRLQTLDKTNPEVVLYALRTDVVALYEKIRVAVEASKAQRGVRVVDYE